MGNNKGAATHRTPQNTCKLGHRESGALVYVCVPMRVPMRVCMREVHAERSQEIALREWCVCGATGACYPVADDELLRRLPCGMRF